MDPLMTILAYATAMFVGSFLAGSLPMAFRLSEDRLRVVTAFGAGLLVGTSLAIIIPEGVHAMYAPGVHVHGSAVAHDHADGGDSGDHDHAGEHGGAVMQCQDASPLKIGMALTLGFVLMMMIDQIGQGHGHSHGAGAAGDAEGGAQPRGRSMTATIGLIVHCAADGLALAAAVASQQSSVEMVVFMAILLHKAPAAFGLTSFLLHEGYNHNRIRRHLAAFSISAPVSAVVALLILQYRNAAAEVDGSGSLTTGIALLLSGGTFLYVATVHVLPEINQGHGSDSAEAKRSNFFAMVAGTIVPLFMAAGHSH